MPAALHRALLLALLTLPWLWPFTFGPSAGAEPYLVCAALAAVALALWPAHDAAGGARIAAGAWLAAALASGAIALLQYFDLETPFYPWINIAEPGQAFGNLRQPNQLATLLVIGALALRTAWQERMDPRQAAARALGPNLALAMTLALALLVLALAATASRVGLVELLACGALALWWARAARQPAQGRDPRAPLAAAFALALYVLAMLALPLLAQWAEGIAGRDMIERLRSAESTCGSRLILYRNVLHLIGLKPWTGWGWGELGYAHYITLYDGPRFCHILDNAHNLPLHLAVELGAPAALLACALAAWLVWRARPWAERQPARQLAWGALLAIGIHSLVEYPLWYGPFQVAAITSVWLLWATRARAGARTPASPWPRHAAAAALLCAVAYAGWDYHRVSQIYLPPEQRSPRYRDDPMAHARQSWLYAGVTRFADVTSRAVTRDNAAWMLPAALQTLHYSAESRVIIQVIESASVLGQNELALEHLERFRAAFPREYRAWADENQRLRQGALELAP